MKVIIVILAALLMGCSTPSPSGSGWQGYPTDENGEVIPTPTYEAPQ